MELCSWWTEFAGPGPVAWQRKWEVPCGLSVCVHGPQCWWTFLGRIRLQWGTCISTWKSLNAWNGSYLTLLASWTILNGGGCEGVGNMSHWALEPLLNKRPPQRPPLPTTPFNFQWGEQEDRLPHRFSNHSGLGPRQAHLLPTHKFLVKRNADFFRWIAFW